MIVSDGDHGGSLDALNCKMRKQVTRRFQSPPWYLGCRWRGHLLWGKIASPQSFLEMLPQTYPEGHLLLMPHPLRLTIKPNHPNHQVHGAVWRQREGWISADLGEGEHRGEKDWCSSLILLHREASPIWLPSSRPFSQCESSMLLSSELLLLPESEQFLVFWAWMGSNNSIIHLAHWH